MKYRIQSENGNVTIKMEVEPSQLGKRLLQISNAMKLSTLLVTDETEHTFTWTYDQVIEVREQLETLVVQNFRDAWEECLSEHMEDIKEQGLKEGTWTEEEGLRIRNEVSGWEDAKEDFLKDYFSGLEELIKKESGLFK